MDFCKKIYEFSKTLNPFFLAAGGANPIDQAPSAPAVRQVVRQQPRGGGGGGSPRVTATPKQVVRQTTPTVTARSQQQQNINNRIGEILSATSASEPPAGKDSNTLSFYRSKLLNCFGHGSKCKIQK